MKKSAVILFTLISLQVLCNFLVALSQQGNVLDSLHYLLESAHNDSEKVRYLVEISRTYEPVDLSRSLRYSEKAMEMAEKASDRKIEAFAIFNLGNVAFNSGLYEIAAQYFYKYLEIQRELDNTKLIPYAFVNLGSVSLATDQLDAAKKYLQEAMESFKALSREDTLTEPPSELITIYNNLGIIEQRQNNANQAIDFYRRGTSIALKADGQHINLANLYNNLGSVYLDIGKLDEALESFNEALEIRLKTRNRAGEASSYHNLARYHLKRMNYRQALDYLKRGYSIAEEVGNLSLLADISERFFQHYHSLNNADSALKYHLLLSEFNDKMNKDATLKELTRIELTSQFYEREIVRALDQKRKETRYIIIGLVLIMLLAIIGLLYFLSLSRMRRLRLERENINLASKNLKLEKLNLEKELEFKNKELATNVMYQIRKNDLIHDITRKLMNYSQRFRREDHHLLVEIIKDLEKTQESGAWNEFELRFQQVHNEFYDKLNEINPDLSPNDRRICAFLRLNMTTKEIASITGQSIRSIEVARTRLRRKLDLTNSETGLIEFLSSL